ncbi:sulfite exporter TauE/SafE family protein [Alteribacter natronophilus]|nr:sulfite exporter TauE/SafE family protein [Alteribacter natronophilus]
MNAAMSVESVPILFALMLGSVGALAPCQFSGNLSAITLYGSKSINKGVSWSETLFYTLGKVVAFTGLGAIVWLLGQEFQRELTLYFPWIRRLLGPMLIVIGLYMVGVFKLRGNLFLWKQKKHKQNGGKWGAFMLGFSFSLGFCPTMFLLFFMLLMPLTLSTSYGAVLPGVFAIGTAIPFLIVILAIWYLGSGSSVIKRGRKIGKIIQYSAGVFMILLGVLDMLTFW